MYCRLIPTESSEQPKAEKVLWSWKTEDKHSRRLQPAEHMSTSNLVSCKKNTNSYHVRIVGRPWGDGDPPPVQETCLTPWTERKATTTHDWNKTSLHFSFSAKGRLTIWAKGINLRISWQRKSANQFHDHRSKEQLSALSKQPTTRVKSLNSPRKKRSNISNSSQHRIASHQHRRRSRGRERNHNRRLKTRQNNWSEERTRDKY